MGRIRYLHLIGGDEIRNNQKTQLTFNVGLMFGNYRFFFLVSALGWESAGLILQTLFPPLQILHLSMDLLLSRQVSQLASQLSHRLHLFHGITCTLLPSLLNLASLLKFLCPHFCFLFWPLPKSSYLLPHPCLGLPLPLSLCLSCQWFYYSGSCSMISTSLQPPCKPLLIDRAVEWPQAGGPILYSVWQQGALFSL